MILLQFSDHSEVIIRNDSGIDLHVYTFDTTKAAMAFCSGFQCAREVANSLIQSMPYVYSYQPPAN